MTSMGLGFSFAHRRQRGHENQDRHPVDRIRRQHRGPLSPDRKLQEESPAEAIRAITAGLSPLSVPRMYSISPVFLIQVSQNGHDSHKPQDAPGRRHQRARYARQLKPHERGGVHRDRSRRHFPKSSPDRRKPSWSAHPWFTHHLIADQRYGGHPAPEAEKPDLDEAPEKLQ